uniref:C3/C5 convertase n=1 Tax=Periophthalmus magnuspinnatus TaxID=409849 RepID=A0A3B3ZN92_9GOBI
KMEKVQIEGGTYTLSNQLQEASILSYHCEEGHYPYPHLVRVCKFNGLWEPAPTKPSKCRPVQCPDPTVVENANVLPRENQYFHQNEIRYECYGGYELYGPSHRTCLASGKWSGPHPVCRRDSGDHCPDPGIPPGGSRTGTLFGIGEKVTYTCNGNKMILIGSEERVCQEDGHWSGIEPTCYYQHTYDSPLEVSHVFGGGIKHTFASLQTENVTQEGRTIKLTKSEILNIYIALDISSSINQEQFENARKAVLTLIEKIASFSVTPNYEIIFFSAKPIEVVNILSFFDNKTKSLADMVKELETFKIQRQNQAGTNLNEVFQKFQEKMAIIKQRQANFKEHQHVIIVFTDGGYNMGGNPTETVNSIKAEILMDKPKERAEHLDIYIFGVGTQIYDRNLKSLTVGTGEKHFFRLQTLQDLHKTFDEIINEEDVKGLCGLHRNYGDMPNLRQKRQKYPWVMFVSIMTDEKTSNCLGSLVSPRFVLTAAHCFTVGDFIEKMSNVKKIHTHPKYNISSKRHRGIHEFYDYDVALIELVKDVPISPSLRPICLPCTEETNGALRQTLTCEQQERLLLTNNDRIGFLTKRNLVEKDAHIKLGENVCGNCIIKALQAKGINTTNVAEVVTDSFLCSGGDYPAIDKIACRGDSGGAVFKNYLNRTIQVSISLPQSKSNNKDSRDFHFNIFKVVPFLKSILGKTGQDYVPLVFVD